jgi:uncharacterized repeat protein (TIGR01451 family)
MIRGDHHSTRRGSSRIPILLLFALLLLGTASTAQAQDCSDYGGLLDGFAGTIAPSQLQIDQNCTIRNYTAANPLRTNFAFLTQPGQTEDRYLVVFDNVVHTGQMACNSVAGHVVWFTNGSSTAIQDGCQNLLIPVEKIDKQNPAGQTTASIGVPFTYTLTMPVLFDSGTGTVIDNSGSLNDLHDVTLTDNLTETGADLSYVSHVAYVQGTSTPVPHTFSNVGGALHFDDFPIIPAGQQIVIELTVVLNDTPANVVGTQFINTAKWDFGRLIDGVFYEPLPGEWGISDPLTIAAPELIVTKTGPTTLGRTLNLGEFGQFAVDVQNTGLGDAWNVTILDRLPDGPTGGMCNLTPEVLSARVFAADGVTPVPGKGPLVSGSDFSFRYDAAPSCELTLSMLTPAGTIGATERLIVSYRTQLDADSQDGASLTNVVGATQWFNGDDANTERVAFVRTLTDGTVGVSDHEDAHTVSVALFGYFFEKSVEDLTTGVNPAATAGAGDTLRYTLRLQTTDVALDSLAFVDDLGALNTSAVFVPGSLSLVAGSLPAAADSSNTNPSGGTNGAGLLDIRNLSLPANSEIRIQFDITLAGSLIDGTVVTNQADLLRTVKIADSDDPNVNGQADPTVSGDEDPTVVVIATLPVDPLLKEITQATASIGESFQYRVTVPELPYPFDLYDVQITDDLAASAADLRFLGVTKIAGSQAWTPSNSGTATSIVIEDLAAGIDIPAGEQVVLEISVVLEDTPTNASGLSFANTAAYLYDRVDDDPTSQQPGPPGTSAVMTIVGPDTLTLEKSGPGQMTVGTPATFTLDVHNTGTGSAYELRITDQLPNSPAGGTCDTPPSTLSAQVFLADGVTAVSPALMPGTDFALSFNGAPTCSFELVMLSSVTALGPDERLIATYETLLDAGTQDGTVLTNVAGATLWFGADGQNPETVADRRVYTRAITDGSVGVLDHEDAHSVAIAIPQPAFEKTVMNVTSGADPATTAAPGDTLRYRLRVENLGSVPIDDFSISDELDQLNTPALFQPGTLTLVTTPAGADSSATSSTGGGQGTGLVDLRNLNLPNLNDSLVIEYEVTLAPVIANGRYASNQAQLSIGGVTLTNSDDPFVNGPADPMIAGDEDPTRVLIQSAPAFVVEKVSSDQTGDPALLLAGETLRYTITVRNVGNADATDAMLRDSIPVNTRYVADSTTLNGAAVADGAGGVAPLSSGILIQAPGDPTAGVMRASPAPDNVATLEFEVVVDANALDGTIISNQAFVSALGGGVSDHPSDDPGTSIPGDPTRDVVGAVPLLFAPKSAALQVDAGTPGVVDPGDVLRYTIAVHNSGAVAATGVTLSDAVPANTTYLADTLTLNGLPVGQPDGGVSPLALGIPISSTNLTPPLPGPGTGTIDPGASATVQFDLQVNAGVPGGTLITNQAVVGSSSIPNLLTDGDGDPATGPEPTVVVVGDGQQVAITKQVAVVGGGAALPGSQLEYVVRVVNIASVPAYDIVISDDLDAPILGQLSYLPASATMNGAVNGVTVTGALVTANYFAEYGPLQPGESILLRFRAAIDPGIAMGTRITNTGVVRWDDPSQMASASVSVDVGGMPGVGVVSGSIWHDADFDRNAGAGELRLEGWIAEFFRNGQSLQSTATDATGTYQIGGIAPNDLSGDQYELRFRAPDAGAGTAALGRAESAFTNGMQTISDILVPAGSNLQGLDLPIDPNGVVYDAIRRTPVPGVTLTLLRGSSSTALPSSCFDDPAQQGQITRSDGYYKFDLNFSQAACPSAANYQIAIISPGPAFVDGMSQLIPPSSDASTAPFSVPACPGTAADAVPATAVHCEAQLSEFAPSTAVPARTAGTTYYAHLTLDASQAPGSSQLFNNHIALDPVLAGAVAITKTTPSLNVSRGQLVPYQITVRNTLAIPLTQINVVDRFPAGFRYVEDSARIDGVEVEPQVDGRQLVFENVTIPASGESQVQLLLVVGAGVTDGEYVNRAQAVNNLNGLAVSGEATATVRLAPDPDFACTDVMGKVFDDKNQNQIQESEELGLAGVRLVTARGLIATTDQHGRFHITCAVTPNEGRGSNFALKLDDRSLPSGFRSSGRELQVKRATQGKALRFNFGASVHRVVGLDVADAVFEPGSTEMRTQWQSRIGLLLDELRKAPSILRLSYVADTEDEDLVEDRLASIEKLIEEAWEDQDSYELTIEPEIFWRRGAPVEDR